MSRTIQSGASEYRAAMRHAQETALHLYRAVRAEPTEHGLTMLKVTTEILREVTQAAKQYPPPRRLPSIIIQVDYDGTILRRSIRD